MDIFAKKSRRIFAFEIKKSREQKVAKSRNISARQLIPRTFCSNKVNVFLPAQGREMSKKVSSVGHLQLIRYTIIEQICISIFCSKLLLRSLSGIAYQVKVLLVYMKRTLENRESF